MRRRWRTVASAAAAGALALLLSACLKLDMDLEVHADDTVSGSVVFALDKQLLELTGQSPEDLLGTAAPLPTDVEGVSSEPYEDDRFQGQEYSFDSVPLERFNEGDGDVDALRIVRDGDVFRVTGALDLSEATQATGVTGFPDVEQAFEGAELRIRMTFPGEVTESNGTVDGNSVTWEPRIGERTEIRATASAVEGAGGGSNLAVILIVVGVVAVLAIVVAIVATRRRGATPAAPGEFAAGGPGAASPISGTAPPSGGVSPPPGGEGATPATPVGDTTPATTPPVGDVAPPAPPPAEEPTPRPAEERPPTPPPPPHGEGEEPPSAPPA